ncbi:MAG: ABC transporter permease [Protaetiibacter sp.]
MTTSTEPAVDGPRTRRFGTWASRAGELWILGILVVLMLFFTVATGGVFLSSSNLSDMLLNTTSILIIAASQTIVLIAAGIDLSIGSVIVFCSVAAATMFRDFSGSAENGYPTLILAVLASTVVTIVLGIFWGFLNGWLAARMRIPAFIATLGTLGMALGLAQVWTSGLNVTGVPSAIQQGFAQTRFLGVIPWPVLITAFIVAGLWILLHHTRFGMRTYALGSNPESLRRAGVNVVRHLIIVYTIAGALAGVVALMEVARFSTVSLMSNTQTNLNAIAAVVIGGTSLFGGYGKMLGTIVGAFIPAVLRNGFVLMGIQPFWQTVVLGAVLILAVFADQVRRGNVPFGSRRHRARAA